MPNWCTTTYYCEGHPLEIRALHKVMSSIDTKCLSDLVCVLNGDPEKISTRGEWDGLEYYDSPFVIRFSLETAWSEYPDFRHFLESIFPSIKIYHMSEEPGMGCFWTNDREGRFFPDRYCIETEDNYYFCKTFGEAIGILEDTIGRPLKKDESPEDALDWFEEKTGRWAVFRIYEFQED